jgi:hypothetical protein
MADRQVAVAEATKKITEKMAEDIAKIAKEGGGYE